MNAVLVEGVSKAFELPHERVHTLKERALHPFRRATSETLRALQDVSFEVREGEFFGIVGRNGSGKSTLLKCLAGIYATDRGAIYVDGQVSTFIELGVGFNPDLAAYDNVMINAAMLGLSTREARRRYERIIDFAELHDFTELKIKNYSSGMLVRLAFSVMIQVDADILLIDEVLAVGDASFQQKCFDEFARIRRSGATVVLVTHDMSAVRRFCDRAMLLESGRLVEIGEPDRVGQRYLELNFSSALREPDVLPEDGGDDAEDGRRGDGAGEVVDVWLEGEDGVRTDIVENASQVTAHVTVRFHEAVDDPLFGVLIEDDLARPVIDMNNLEATPAGRFEAGGAPTGGVPVPGRKGRRPPPPPPPP